MPVTLYKLDLSPPARAAMMGVGAFNAPVEMVDVDVVKRENLTPDYIKKNPIHSIPVLTVDDFVIHDSHAILMYLADVYGNDSSMYPKDLKKRTNINQKLFFDTSILFPRLRSVSYPLVVQGLSFSLSETQHNNIEEAYDMLEKFLSQSKFIADDQITIADIAAYATISALIDLLALNKAKYPKVQAWIETMEKQPYSKKYNAPGAKIIGDIYRSRLIS